MSVLFTVAPMRAELPQALLSSIAPAGAARGSSVEVTIGGQDLDEVKRLYFSSPNITAEPKLEKNGAPVAGKFVVKVGPDVRAGLYDVRAVGRYGVSNPRTFQVGTEAEVTFKPGNTTPQNAVEIPEGGAIHAVAEANAAHYYRLNLKKGQPVHVEASTASIDSRMEAEVLLIDPAGREAARSQRGEPIDCVAAVDGPHVLKVHDVLYRGGADYFYRLSAAPRNPSGDAAATAEYSTFRWPVPSAAAFLDPGNCRSVQMEGGPTFLYLPPSKIVSTAGSPHEKPEHPLRLEPPCVVVGRFEGRAQSDWYEFDVPAGTAYWIEVVSHRLGEATSAMMLVQRLEKDEKGGMKAIDVQEVGESPTPGLAEFPAASRDPAYRLEVKQAGVHRVLVRNLFRTLADRSGAAYCLEIRKESPDFRLVAVPASPLADPKDSKDIPVSTTLLRRGGVTAIRVAVQRRDGFAGEIRLAATGLPAGVTAMPATIPAAATTGTILLAASADAAPAVVAITISGSAAIGGAEVTRAARAGVVGWSAYDKQNKRMDMLRPRLTAEYMIGIAPEDCPLAIAAAADHPLEAKEGTKLSIPLKFARHAEVAGPISLKLSGHPALGAGKEVNVDGKADAGNVELDLSQVKLPPGEYTLHVEAQAKVKYSRKAGEKTQVSDVTGTFFSTPIVVRVVAVTKPGK